MNLGFVCSSLTVIAQKATIVVLVLLDKRCNNILLSCLIRQEILQFNVQRQHLNQYIKFTYIENVIRHSFIRCFIVIAENLI